MFNFLLVFMVFYISSAEDIRKYEAANDGILNQQAIEINFSNLTRQKQKNSDLVIETPEKEYSIVIKYT